MCVYLCVYLRACVFVCVCVCVCARARVRACEQRVGLGRQCEELLAQRRVDEAVSLHDATAWPALAPAAASSGPAGGPTAEVTAAAEGEWRAADRQFHLSVSTGETGRQGERER